MISFKLQPKERSNMQLPYPFFVSETGKIGRQDFWKGKPSSLIGFDISPSDHGASGKSVTFDQFKGDPNLALGMYPIFRHSGGKWVTWDDPIDSVIVDVDGTETRFEKRSIMKSIKKALKKSK